MFTIDRFERALSLLAEGPAPELFKQLQEMYSESGRYYHTDRHVAECLGALDRYEHLADNSAELEIAIWFHDAVYDTRRGDNEEQSAALAGRVLSSLGARTDAVVRIESMILATKSHYAGEADAELMLDIDLAILGQPTDIFTGYDEAIRKEYAWVAEDRYLSGRAAILQSFLERPQIYCTSVFQDLYEDQARRNLESRLRELVAPQDDEADT